MNIILESYPRLYWNRVINLILSRRHCPTVYAHAITAVFFFLVNIHSLTKNCNGKVQVFLIRCLGHLEWVTMSSLIHFRSSCFQEETQASSFIECLPRYFLSIHWHHALWCHHIQKCKSHQMHLAAKLTRSSWAPTISLGSHQNIGLHTGRTCKCCVTY